MPKLMCMNAVGDPAVSDEVLELVKNRQSRENPAAAVCRHRYKCMGVFREKFELELFPFDTQPLNIILSSHLHAHELTLLHDEEYSSTVRTEYMVMPEFNLSDVQFYATQTAQAQEERRYPLRLHGHHLP